MGRLCDSFRALLRVAVRLLDRERADPSSDGEVSLEQEKHHELPAGEKGDSTFCYLNDALSLPLVVLDNTLL